MKCLLALIVLAGMSAVVWPVRAGEVKVDVAPPGEVLSKDYTVQVEGRDVPVYVAKVAPGDPTRRWMAMDDKTNSAAYYELAAFAYFDMQGTVTVTVSCPELIRSAKVLPSSLNLTPIIMGRNLTLTLAEPKPISVEVNGNRPDTN